MVPRSASARKPQGSNGVRSLLEHEILRWLSSDNGLAVHVGVFVLLLLGGLGFPIPEDIPIMLAGVASAKGIVRLHNIFITAYLGVVIADQMVYLFGYYFGQRMLNASTRTRWFPSITDAKMIEIREGLRKRRLLYIFIGRHLFPVRSLTFLTAGSLRIPYFEFLLADAIAALVSVGIVIIIGHYLGEQLTPEVIKHLTHQAHVYIILFLLLMLTLYVAKRVFFKRKELVPVAETVAPLQEQPVNPTRK